MARFLPILRADFRISETASFADEEPLTCPITALGGTNDERARRPDLEGWRRYTRGRFDVVMFPGDHFFLQRARADVLLALSQRLADGSHPAWAAGECHG